jgi:hypothetical protein
VSVQCGGPVTQYTDATCTDAGVTTLLGAVQLGGLVPGQLGAIDCVASAAVDSGTPFSFLSQARLVIEDSSGVPAGSAERVICTGFRVHATDALGVSVPVTATTTVQVTAWDAGLYAMTNCSDASHDGGLALTIPSGLSSASGGFRAFAPVTTQDFVAVSTDNLLVGSGQGQFSIACRGTGQSCAPNAGVCCNGCNVLSSNTCY